MSTQMMASLRGFDRTLRSVQALLSAAGGVLVVAIMLSISFDVVGRRYFDSPLTGAYETVEKFLMVGLVWLSLPAVQRAGRNVRVGIIVEHLTPKAQFWISAAPNAVVAVTFAVLGWSALDRGIDRWAETTYNTVIPLPVGLSWLMMGLGLLATCLQLVAELLVPDLESDESTNGHAPEGPA